MARLDSDGIAAAALAVLDEHGPKGFTIRAVAEALGVTPMALYHHVENKAELAALVVNYAGRERPLGPPSGVWRDDLWEMARWMRQSVLAHPGVAQLRQTYSIWTPLIMQLTERWISLWQQSGLDVASAVLAAKTSSMAIWGLVDREVIFREVEPPPEEAVSWLPNPRLMYAPRYDSDDTFELAVRSLIDGLHARLSANPATVKPPQAKRRS